MIARAFIAWAVLIITASLGAWLILGQLTEAMVVIIACAAIVALPPGLDPAIQIKERLRGDD